MTMSPLSAERPSRAAILGAMAFLALLLHGMMLFGFQWELAPGAQRPVADTQGVSVDLAPAPEYKANPPAAAQSPPPAPSPEQKTDVLAPQKKTQPTPRMREQKSAATTSKAASATTQTRQPATLGKTSQEAPQAAVSSPEPLPQRVRPEPLPQSVNAKPAYPELARKRGQEGLVRLLARVDATGALRELSVIQSSGFPLLDEAALKTVRTWRFTPGRRAGVPVMGTVTIPVAFQLTP